MGRTHELKSWPRFFNPITNGDRRHELRRNDRNYRVGDLLLRYVRQRLRQFDGDGRDGRVHASQQERGAQARTGAEFEDGAAGLGGPRGR